MQTSIIREEPSIAPPTVLILGAAGHGKDTAAELLCELTGWTFQSSSLFAAEKAVYPVLKERYGYKNIYQCYEDRDAHRIEWFNLIREYNHQNRTRLAEELLRECNIYVGMRCAEEYAAARQKQLFDVVMWVDASQRKANVDPSLKIQRGEEMHVICNNGSKARLKRNIKKWVYNPSTKEV